MSKLRTTLFLAAVLLFSTSLFAQATRTWVSGVGDDVNPCSRTAPCKTFAGAISKTAIGGEIDALDPAGYGTVNITKNMTIDGGGGEGGQVAAILSANTSGIIVNGAGITVNLRNFSINGAGTGTTGIRIINSTHVNIHNLSISGSSKAVTIEQATATAVNIEDTKMFNHTGSAVVVSPGGTNITLRMTNCSVTNNGTTAATADGLFVQNALAIVRNSNFSQNQLAGVEVGAGGNVFIDNSDLSFNTFEGVRIGGGGTVRLSRSTMTGNNNGATNVISGSLFTFGDNYLGGNPVNNGAGLTAASPGKQ